MEIRLLCDHRNDLIAERTRTVNRLRWHLLTLCPELERSLKRGALNKARELDRVDRRLRKLSAGARVRIAHEQVSQLRSLNRQIDQLEAELRELVKVHRPQLLAELGCGAVVAAILIGHTAGVKQFRKHSSFGLQTETAPDPMLLRSAHPASAQPWRGPPAQPRAAHHRGHPRPTRPRDPGVPRSQRGRRQNHARRFYLLLAEPPADQQQTAEPESIPERELPAILERPRPRARRPADQHCPSPMICIT